MNSEATKIGGAMAAASAWMIAGRWILRLIGAVSTIVLARLLSPSDFGLIAMAMIVIGMLQILAEAGQRHAIVRMRKPTPAHYNSAWTMSVGLGVFIFLCLAAAAYPTAWYLSEPRLVEIIFWLALRPLIQGFENIGIVDLQRRLDFRRDFQIMIIGKGASFAVTIVLAFTLQNYWALIAGTLFQAVAAVSLSYYFAAFRPRFDVSKISEIWSFSAWSLAANVAHFLSDKADHVVIANRFDSASMGTYAVAGEIGVLATEELVTPPVKALFAVYSRFFDDFEQLRKYYLSALSFIAIAATASSVGVSVVASDAVTVLLGEKWLSATSLVPWFALTAGVIGIARSVNAVLLAAGRAYAHAWRAIAFATVLFPAALLGVHWGGIEGAAIARFLVTLAFAPIMLFLAMRLLHIGLLSMLDVLWRPCAAAAAMASVVLLAEPLLPAIPPLRLGLEIVLGAAVYAGALLLAWLVSGCPEGAEKTLMATLRSRLTRSPPESIGVD